MSKGDVINIEDTSTKLIIAISSGLFCAVSVTNAVFYSRGLKSSGDGCSNDNGSDEDKCFTFMFFLNLVFAIISALLMIVFVYRLIYTQDERYIHRDIITSKIIETGKDIRRMDKTL